MNDTATKTITGNINKFIHFFNKIPTKTRIIVSLVTLLLIVIFIVIILPKNKPGRLTTISKASLQKIVEINELSTVDYTYNATAAEYSSKNPAEVLYYVAYEGTVTAGIDFHKINIDVDDKNKIVLITLPEVEIHSVSVDMGTLDYIFVNKASETETVSQEAYKLCKSDLIKRIEDEKLLYNTAKDNAVSSVKALFKPFIETVDKEYKITIK